MMNENETKAYNAGTLRPDDHLQLLQERARQFEKPKKPQIYIHLRQLYDIRNARQRKREQRLDSILSSVQEGRILTGIATYFKKTGFQWEKCGTKDIDTHRRNLEDDWIELCESCSEAGERERFPNFFRNKFRRNCEICAKKTVHACTANRQICQVCGWEIY